MLYTVESYLGYDNEIPLLYFVIFGSEDFGDVIIACLFTSFNLEEIGESIAINVSVVLSGQWVKKVLSEVIHYQILVIDYLIIKL